MAGALEVEPHSLHFQPPPAPPPHRPPPSICDLHPNETVTGFCASCLRERLAGLEASANAGNAPGRKSTSALRSIFLKVSGAGGGGGGGGPQMPSGSSSFRRPELRRCKSFSFARSDGFTGPRTSTSAATGASFEPQRRSCDVRGRSTLWSLFHQDDQNRMRDPSVPSSSMAGGTAAVDRDSEPEQRNLGFAAGASSFAPPVVEAYEDEETGDEIRPVDPVIVMGTSGEIEEETSRPAAPDLKPMKDHISLDSHQQQQQQAKKPDLKEIAGSFWLAASVFSKKLQKWRRKQKLKRQCSKAAAAAMPTRKPPKLSQRFRDTQSEMAFDAFGRRSCDTDPRFSLDAARMSFDDPRYSLDEPRASWDGYLIGGRSVFPRIPPMLSVVEDAPATVVQRSDGLIPVEEDAFGPGGSLQTRDYYLDSSSRRRQSLDRSSSIREQPTEMNEPRSVVFNAKVTPAGSTELFHFHSGNSIDKDLKDWSSNSLRDDYSGSFESVFRDARKVADRKKPRRWGRSWNIWGFIHRRHGSRGGANVVDRSFSESWPELRSQAYSGKFMRSNSNASSRSSYSINGGYGSMRRTGSTGTKGNDNNKGEFVLKRNRSTRYSPSHVDNGMLRFYLTPTQNGRRKGNSINGRHISSQYFTRSMLGLY